MNFHGGGAERLSDFGIFFYMQVEFIEEKAIVYSHT